MRVCVFFVFFSFFVFKLDVSYSCLQGTVGFRNARKGTNIAAQAAAISLAEVEYVLLSFPLACEITFSV